MLRLACVEENDGEDDKGAGDAESLARAHFAPRPPRNAAVSGVQPPQHYRAPSVVPMLIGCRRCRTCKLFDSGKSGK